MDHYLSLRQSGIGRAAQGPLTMIDDRDPLIQQRADAAGPRAGRSRSGNQQCPMTTCRSRIWLHRRHPAEAWQHPIATWFSDAPPPATSQLFCCQLDTYAVEDPDVVLEDCDVFLTVKGSASAAQYVADHVQLTKPGYAVRVIARVVQEHTPRRSWRCGAYIQTNSGGSDA
jgi:hypothetical protein